MKEPRSYCPQSVFLDVLGDKWTLLIIRDLMISRKHYFREFLQSKEKIASNILSSRLTMLEEEGIVRKEKDPTHKQKIKYLLTEKGIDLFPILMENARWSLKYKTVDKDDANQAQAILEGAPESIEQMMKALKNAHRPS